LKARRSTDARKASISARVANYRVSERNDLVLKILVLTLDRDAIRRRDQ
jgi:hypothetical protein